MLTLRLHADLYRIDAVEETGRAFAEHCQMDITREDPYLRVNITGGDAASEERLAGEFANYALALTVEKRY